MSLMNLLLMYIFLACTKGYFGTNCSWVCSPYCKPDTCLHTDGSCTECVSGWKGYNCTTGNSINSFQKCVTSLT